ncbi:MAG: CoA pyrophosphatase [Desulfobacteraceae bacterium]|nr:CoA pyrophosphatase [Desulfobacteraceae bacterium]
MSDQKCLPDTISDILSSREPRFFDDKGSTNYRPAGVLLPLLEEGGVCKVLFTKRTDSVEHHKGQISFPGGAVDKRDASIEETVLRETYEEIGLSEKDIEILGRIDDALTVASNYVIHPFVGMVTSMDDLAINRAEVKRVITVPLSLFHDVGSEKRRYPVEYDGVTYQTSAYEYREHIIWGATARIMENFMEIIGDKLCLPQAQK